MALSDLALREIDFRIGFLGNAIYLFVNNLVVNVYSYTPDYNNVKYDFNDTRLNFQQEFDILKFRESTKNLRPIIL